MANPTVKIGVAEDNLIIPLIDFEPFLASSADTSQKQHVAEAITTAFRSSGFLYLQNHGIPLSAIKHVFATSATFFARPQEQKEGLSWTTPDSNRGYVTHGREKVSLLTDATAIQAVRSANPDLKETMEIGRDDVPELPNRWPDQLKVKDDVAAAQFKETMLSFSAACKNLQLKVMSAIALGLGLDENFFNAYVDAGDNNLRLLHYPPVPKSTFMTPGTVRAGEHSDYGTITLLFQDARGGLQVQSPNGTFVDATPIEGAIVINAGDLLARWANDSIKSTRHRVVEPPPVLDADNGEGETYPARYSIAYFCNPNFDSFIEALPGTWNEGTPKRYEGINSGQYLVQRLAATYS